MPSGSATHTKIPPRGSSKRASSPKLSLSAPQIASHFLLSTAVSAST